MPLGTRLPISSPALRNRRPPGPIFVRVGTHGPCWRGAPLAVDVGMRFAGGGVAGKIGGKAGWVEFLGFAQLLPPPARIRMGVAGATALFVEFLDRVVGAAVAVSLRVPGCPLRQTIAA